MGNVRKAVPILPMLTAVQECGISLSILDITGSWRHLILGLQREYNIQRRKTCPHTTSKVTDCDLCRQLSDMGTIGYIDVKVISQCFD